MGQTICANRFIHRRFNKKKEEVQCPLCGKKLVVWSDENHLEIETQHGLSCGVKNRQSKPADELRYG